MIKKFAQKYGIDEDCLEEIEKKSQWIKGSGKELDLDLYGELT